MIWCSQLSGLTPPVCLVAYAAAAANGDPFKTGVESLKYGMYLLVLPLLFVYTPLLLTGNPTENALVVVTSLIAVFSFAFFLQRFFLRKNSLLEQLLFGVGTFLLFSAHFTWNLVGAAAVIVAVLLQIRFRPGVTDASTRTA